MDLFNVTTLALVAGSMFLLIWSIFRYPVASTPAVHRRIALAMGVGQRSTLFEVRPLAPAMHMLLTIARRFNVAWIRRRIRKDLDAAGNRNGYSVDEYLALTFACAAITAGITALLSFTIFSIINLPTVAIFAAAGFVVPILNLYDGANRRVMRISRQVPYTIDLVALMMAAGSTFVEAIDTIIRDNPDDDLNQELSLVRAEIDFGAQRAAALKNMADRIPLESLRSVVGAVNQADVLGTPLSEILKLQSDMMRMHRSVRAEKLSASASLRILFPTMLILMAVMLFVLGPLIIRWFEGSLL